MKLFRNILICILLLTNIGYAQNNLIKSGNNLLKVGNNLITIPFNQYSMLFDGVDEYINIDNVRTVLATTTKGTWIIRAKPVDATPASIEYIMTFGDTNTNEIIYFVILTDGKLRALVRKAGTNQWFINTTNQVFFDGVWIHIALVQNGVSPVILVNGVVVPQTFGGELDKTAWFNDLTGLDNGRIGNHTFNNSGEVGHFNGELDEPRFWDIDKSIPEVLNDHNNGVAKKPLQAGLVSNFRMGDRDTFDGSNWTLIDNTGNNNGASVNMEFIDRVHIK